MSVVSLLGVEVQNNPAPFDAPYEFVITFECLEQLQKGSLIVCYRAVLANSSHRSRVEVDLCWLCYLVSFASSCLRVITITTAPSTSLLETLTRFSNEYDQELDSILVGPLPIGVNKFTFNADPPDLSRIPNSEIIGVTVILLSCSYEGREFVRVGYYVNNEYTDEALALEPPAKPVIEKVQRQILAEKPRVTRFAIKWYDVQSNCGCCA